MRRTDNNTKTSSFALLRGAPRGRNFGSAMRQDGGTSTRHAASTNRFFPKLGRIVCRR
jgi:hypothetical protein